MFWRASVEFPYYISENPSCNKSHNSFLCNWAIFSGVHPSLVYENVNAVSSFRASEEVLKKDFVELLTSLKLAESSHLNFPTKSYDQENIRFLSWGIFHWWIGS
jgi:hypothetical protein